MNKPFILDNKFSGESINLYISIVIKAINT